MTEPTAEEVIERLQKSIEEQNRWAVDGESTIVGDGPFAMKDAITLIQQQADRNDELTHMVKDINDYEDEIDAAQTKIAELEEALKSAQSWDDIESERNEKLQARINELERIEK